jgi:hydrogenase expression/formation protein HypC
MCLAVPGKIASIEHTPGELGSEGSVDFGGVLRRVNLTLVPEAQVGDYVLAHVGVALCRLDQAEAERALALFEELARAREPER